MERVLDAHKRPYTSEYRDLREEAALSRRGTAKVQDDEQELGRRRIHRNEPAQQGVKELHHGFQRATVKNTIQSIWANGRTTLEMPIIAGACNCSAPSPLRLSADRFTSIIGTIGIW